LLTVSQSGTYKVSGSCGLNEVDDEIEVTFTVTPTPEVTITQPTCEVLTGTVVVTAPVSAGGVLPSNLFISEVTDEPSGSSSPSLSYVEIFNGTGASVNLSNYKLKVYANGIAAPQCDFPLTGSIANNTTKIIKLSTDSDQPGIVSIESGCTGVNENDSIVLTTSTDAVVDVWGINGTDFTPLNTAGYDYRRNTTAAAAPSTTWNAADWTVIDWNATTLQDYSNVGSFPAVTAATYEYNIDGGAWQSSTTFNFVAVGPHVINVRDIITNCTSSLNIDLEPSEVDTPITTISYTTPVCNSIATSSPNTPPTGFATGGTYSADSPALIIDANTGVIDVLNSPAGDYVITYAVGANLANCFGPGSSTTPFTITAIKNPDFATPLTFCSGTVAPLLGATSPNGLTGTWLPATIDNTVDATYEFTPDPGQCASNQIISVDVTPPTNIPDFATPITFCSGTVAPLLGLTSPNGITGTWLPATIDNAVDATYEFTPDPGQCATNQIISVDVTPPSIVPDFATPVTFCSGTVAPLLGLTSPNGITGTWLPATIDNTVDGTYEFTPDPGQCASNQIISVDVTPPNIVPDFATPSAFCSGTNAPLLGATSPNGITGTWSPTTIDNTTVGASPYTFTPTAGQCATNQTITATVLPSLTSDFADIPTICSGATVPTLATTSPNGIVGLWSPSTIDPTQSGTYTFTPDAAIDACAIGQVLEVTIAPNPVFSVIGGCINGDYTLTVTSTSDLETASFIWKNAAGTVIGGNNSSIVVTQTGDYTCEVTYQGCSASDIFPATTISCTIQKGISPKGTGTGDGLNDYLDLEGQNVSKLEIFNRYGSKVYSKANYSKEWYGQSDAGDELPDGTYFYVIERNGEDSKTGWIYINHEL
jgi:gliding motility-associated-like protein